jgi:hypothetical protein
VEVYLNLQQDQLLYTTDLPRQPLGCGCPTCVITVNYTVDASFPRYNYSVNGTNQLQVIVTGNAICLHAINLTFHYQSFPRHDVSFWDRVLSEIGWIVAGGGKPAPIRPPASFVLFPSLSLSFFLPIACMQRVSLIRVRSGQSSCWHC